MSQKLPISMRYCYSSRRAAQNMSATGSFSTIIIINLHGLPLSAVTVSLHSCQVVCVQ